MYQYTVGHGRGSAGRYCHGQPDRTTQRGVHGLPAPPARGPNPANPAADARPALPTVDPPPGTTSAKLSSSHELLQPPNNNSQLNGKLRAESQSTLKIPEYRYKQPPGPEQPYDQ
jgi:hypothetical protein